MNKIKVLYDVVKTMKKKDIINGVVNMEVIKGETKIISFTNEFYRNNISGDIKAKIINELNVDGKKIKNQTDAEFKMKDCPYHKFHHSIHRHNQEHLGLKSKLSKAAFILNILNNLKADDKDSKTVLSLDLKEVIKEGKEIGFEYQKSLNVREMDESQRGHHHHKFIKQLLCAEYKDAVLNVIVNKENEVEKVEISANGENIINGSININC